MDALHRFFEIAKDAMQKSGLLSEGFELEMVQKDVAFEDSIFSAEFLSMCDEAKTIVDTENIEASRTLFARTKHMEHDNERGALRNYLTLNFAPADGKNQVDFNAVDMVLAAIEQTKKTILVERKGKAK